MKNLIILFAFLIPSLIFCQDIEGTFKVVPEISPDVEEIFKVVEEMPRFPGCEDLADLKSKSDCSKEKLLEYIYKNLKYPAAAKANKVEGVVVIQFVIDKDGSITNAKVVRDIGAGCGQAALDVVNSMTEMIQDTVTTFDEDTYRETVKISAHRELWRPGYQRGVPVKVLFTLPVKYKLEKEDQTTDQIANPIKEDLEKSPKKWTNFPPEYRSYQHYKDEVLTPTLVQEAYKIEPIEANKIVGDIIPYGEAMHPLLHKMGRHNGIDFRAVPGVAIMATADGIIEVVGNDHKRYGQYVKIKHSEETQSLYAHMSSITVTQGQSVKAGEQIGAVGMSGVATYPHLHYEVHVNGQTENPIIENRDLTKATVENHHTIHLEDLKPIVVDQEIHPKPNELPDVQFNLKQNYPNPVGDNTTISFYLPNDRPASLLFYNQSGEYVYGIKDSFTQGLNEVKISTADLNASGMIYYFLIQDQMTAVKKMIVSNY